MMSPLLCRLPGKNSGDKWELVGSWDPLQKKYTSRDWTYYFFYNGERYKLTIPYGFKCDGSSGPRLFSFVLRMRDRDLPDEAWLPHDYFYDRKGQLTNRELFVLKDKQWNNIQEVDQEFADKVFYAELRSPIHKFPKWRSKMGYWAVDSYFGRRAWRT